MLYESIFFSKVAQKDKPFSRLPEPKNVAPNTKRCSNFGEHNRDGPNDNDKVFNDLHVTEISNKVATRLYFLRQLRKRLDQKPRNILQRVLVPQRNTHAQCITMGSEEFECLHWRKGLFFFSYRDAM